jgi:NMD protein affecting ribosome stability and mRNA decay
MAEQHTEIACPRCGLEDAPDIIDGRCRECRLAEDEAGWMDEDEAAGGSPWGR